MTHPTTAPDDFGSPLFSALRRAAGEDWTAYVGHEFTRRLGDGSLPRQAYLHYLRQDYIFLVHFARAWSLLAFKCADVAEMRMCAATVHDLIGNEMTLHLETCAREGLDEATILSTRERPENVAYTRYVIDRGLAGDALDLLVALAPCLFGYGEIGPRLKAAHGTEGTYGEWISVYSGEDYQGAVRRSAGLFEKVALRTIGPDVEASPRWPSLAEGFAQACRLEQDFWSMGLRP